jgi:hypothetical protein
MNSLMCTVTTLAQQMRDGLRFASDLTDAEQARRFPRRRDAGVSQSINHRLVMLDREHVRREASPSAAVIDLRKTEVRQYDGRNSVSPP